MVCSTQNLSITSHHTWSKVYCLNFMADKFSLALICAYLSRRYFQPCSSHIGLLFILYSFQIHLTCYSDYLEKFPPKVWMSSYFLKLGLGSIINSSGGLPLSFYLKDPTSFPDMLFNNIYYIKTCRWPLSPFWHSHSHYFKISFWLRIQCYFLNLFNQSLNFNVVKILCLALFSVAQ